MLQTIAIVLLVLWAVGLVTSSTWAASFTFCWWWPSSCFWCA